jgi:hypothetical protein
MSAFGAVLDMGGCIIPIISDEPEGGDADLELPEASPPPLDRFFAWLGWPSHAPAAPTRR